MDMVDVVTEDDVVIAQVSRAQAHARGLLHRFVQAFVVDRSGRILVQQRSRKKALGPLLFDAAVGAHVDAGESYEEAIRREGREELGLAEDSNYLLAGVVRDNLTTVENMLGRLYLVHHEGPFSNWEAEAERLEWLTPDELRLMTSRFPYLFTGGMLASTKLFFDLPAKDRARARRTSDFEVGGDVAPYLLSLFRLDQQCAQAPALALLEESWWAVTDQVRGILLDLLPAPGKRKSIAPLQGYELLLPATKSNNGRELCQALSALAQLVWQVKHEAGIEQEDHIAARLMEPQSAVQWANGKRKTPARVIVEPVGLTTSYVGLNDLPVMSVEPFDRKPFSGWLSGRHAAFIGIGGGSDGLQAAQAALESGASPACVISVRSAHSAVNHGEEITPGVWRMTSQTTGSGRFLENLPAELVPTFLVHDVRDGSVLERIMAAVDAAGGADVLVAVDTGGDSLYGTSVEDMTAATPDQDLRVLKALVSQDTHEVMSLILALGVDSPDNAGDVLQHAGATMLGFDENAVTRILARYAAWHARRKNGFLGKTPLAWQAALRGEEGMAVLPIPVNLVLEWHNPWNPFVFIGPAMRAGFAMDARKHLAAIGAFTS